MTQMNFLHLDPAFGRSLPGLDYEAFTFSGGEPHIKIKEQPLGPVTITTRLRSFNDLGLLLVATDALRRMGVRELHAVIPYFPAARQDRVMVPGEPLSVKVYAGLINAQRYNSVRVFDPHSEVTPALLNDVHAVTNHDFVRACLGGIEEPLLISPDGGALKKIYKLSAALGDLPVVECSKSRDVKTGQLSRFTVYTDDLAGRNCVIVDDICDGGATFVGLAAALRAKGAERIYLVISHGIFSKGTAAVTPHFEKVFCSDSFSTLEEGTVIQQRILPFLV